MMVKRQSDYPELSAINHKKHLIPNVKTLHLQIDDERELVISLKNESGGILVVSGNKNKNKVPALSPLLVASGIIRLKVGAVSLPEKKNFFSDAFDRLFFKIWHRE